MKNITWIILASILLSICIATEADAQSRRERRQKRKAMQEMLDRQGLNPKDATNVTRQPVTPKKPIENKPKPAPQAPQGYPYPASLVKDRYRIDILAPFYLSELVQDGKIVDKYKLPNKVLPSIKFYEGLTLAVDTLKKQGYKFDIYVYDVADELESVTTLVNTNAMQGSDLILGILSSNDFPQIAQHVKKHNVNFVSALSPSNQSILNNPYFTMLQPSLETHCERVEEFIYAKNGNIKPILMFRQNVDVDKMALNNFITNNAIEFQKLPCDNMPSRSQLEPLLNANGKNVLLIPILNYKYAEEILLNVSKWFPDYEFEVWGMPSWEAMSALKKRESYPKIAVYFTSPFYFDPTTASGLAIMKAYKAKYGGVADNMVFRGYETMIWYAYLLKKYGNIFNNQLWDNGGAPFTRFDIKEVKAPDGKLRYYENKHLYLYRYQGGSYMVER